MRPLARFIGCTINSRQRFEHLCGGGGRGGVVLPLLELRRARRALLPPLHSRRSVARHGQRASGEGGSPLLGRARPVRCDAMVQTLSAKAAACSGDRCSAR